MKHANCQCGDCEYERETEQRNDELEILWKVMEEEEEKAEQMETLAEESERRTRKQKWWKLS